MKPVPLVFRTPVHVTVLNVVTLLCVVSGFVWVGVAVFGSSGDGWQLSLFSFVAALANYCYTAIAIDAATASWRSELLTQRLEPAIRELQAQADARARQSAAADEALRRTIAERLAQREASDGD